MPYQIITDATADLGPELPAGLPQVTVLPMDLTLEGRPYTYGPGGTISTAEFYTALRAGAPASTAQIGPLRFQQTFEWCLSRGVDVLYLGFSSALSATFQTACRVAQELAPRYPARTIRCVDTRCASVGEGFLVREAARKQAQGLSLDALAAWVEARRGAVCHWFTVDSFTYLRRGGRVSAVQAVFGAALQVKPLLHVTAQGALELAEKPRGRRRAMEAQLEQMRRGWEPGESPLVVIGHGDVPDRAGELRQAVLREFPQAQVLLSPIGPVIGAHTGPGMLALIFWGSVR